MNTLNEFIRRMAVVFTGNVIKTLFIIELMTIAKTESFENRETAIKLIKYLVE